MMRPSEGLFRWWVRSMNEFSIIQRKDNAVRWKPCWRVNPHAQRKGLTLICCSQVVQYHHRLGGLVVPCFSCVVLSCGKFSHPFPSLFCELMKGHTKWPETLGRTSYYPNKEPSLRCMCYTVKNSKVYRGEIALSRSLEKKLLI